VSIVAQIRGSPDVNPEELHNLSRPLDRTLWCLAAARDSGESGPLSVSEIEAILKSLDVAIRRGQIANALNRAQDLVIREPTEHGLRYGIARKGRERLFSIGGKNSIEVMYFEAGRRWSARKGLLGLADTLQGDLAITDRYYGTRSLEVLDALANRSGRVRFLTQDLGGGERAPAMAPQIRDLKSEHPNLEMRRLPGHNQLHDRYILANEAVLLVGPGIKDLGARESFVVLLTESVAHDLHRILHATFDARWATSPSL